ncbi:MAG TPA: hypothetical protein VLZ75_05640 [Chitinophagales bacterium]|nr:hypothetical protein [Chitinophagales bacterium]
MTTLALILSLFLGLFSSDNNNYQESNKISSPTSKIIKPIITDDTGA